jgi:hypothetical protein
MTWELPVVRSVRNVYCESILLDTFSGLIGESASFKTQASVLDFSNEGWPARRFGLDPQFLPALDLHDPRIMDDDFHRSEPQVLQSLQDSLFDFAAFVPSHRNLAVGE